MASSDTEHEKESVDFERTEESHSKQSETKSDDKLEKYLKYIYSKYCITSINEKEREFLRNGVEKLTLVYLQKSYRCSPCEDASCKISKCGELELVGAGSFYEGTRNGFPDEFDFAAILGTVDEEPHKDIIHHLEQGYCNDCEVFKSDEFPDHSLHFGYDTGGFGKAKHLVYVYKRDKEEITISVDIVIALRCYKVENYYKVADVFNKDIYGEMLKTGSFLFIYTGSYHSTVERTSEGADMKANRIGPWEKTITETETPFVRDILSKTHRKVYRILKYIINGPFCDDLFKYSYYLCSISTGFSISSYVIKIAVIHHHYTCKNVLDEVGGCVLNILSYIMKLYDQRDARCIAMHSLLSTNQIGPIIGRGRYHVLGNFYWCFQAFTQRLASLKSSNDDLIKCNHDLENSFLEMALRLDIFAGYETLLEEIDEALSSILILSLSTCYLKPMIKKVKEYNEKRSKIPECPWCDYPIFIMAHKRKL